MRWFERVVFGRAGMGPAAKQNYDGFRGAVSRFRFSREKADEETGRNL